MKTFNEFILVEKVLTKKIKDKLMQKAKAKAIIKVKSDIVEPCYGKTIDQCIVYNQGQDQFLFFFNDKTGSTRMVMEQYIKEKYVTSFEGMYDLVEIFKNPTQRELNDLYKQDNWGGHSNARGYIDKKGNLFAWSTNEFHDSVVKHLDKEKELSVYDNGLEVYIAKPNNVHPARASYLSKSFKADTTKLFNKATKLNPGLKFILKPYSGALN